jgi:hypothetical protein
VPAYWVTGSHCVTRMEYRINILVDATFGYSCDFKIHNFAGKLGCGGGCSLLDERGEHRR